MCLKDLGGNFDRWELRLRTRGWLQDGRGTKFTCFVILSDWFSLVQFARYLQSMCCIRMLCHTLWLSDLGLMCPLPSVRVLTFPKAKVSIQITEMTTHRVMRPAATGHWGLRVSQHVCAVSGVATWGGRELRPRGGYWTRRLCDNCPTNTAKWPLVSYADLRAGFCSSVK